MATTQEYLDKARELAFSANNFSDYEKRQVLMKAASFFQIAIQSSLHPLPEALGELSLTLFQAGDKMCFNYAQQALQHDPHNIEARVVLCIRDLSGLINHRNQPLINTNGAGYDMSSKVAAGAVSLLLNGSINLFSMGYKKVSADSSINNLANAFFNNIYLKRGTVDYYLGHAENLINICEITNYPRVVKPLLQAIIDANWQNLEASDEERKKISDLRMQAEGTILLLR